MKIEALEISGLYPALYGMRDPMDSWAQSDTTWLTMDGPYHDPAFNTKYCMEVGEKDKDLSVRLQKAGPEHCKHLRMVNVYANITAPRYWWTEFDTYRAGVEKVSCSTMHKLMSHPLTFDDFEHDELFESKFQEQIVDAINRCIKAFKDSDDPELRKEIFRGVVQILPQSFLQKRTVMMSYAALRNIYRQRQGHNLIEWHQFCEWVESLPESWMITE